MNTYNYMNNYNGIRVLKCVNIQKYLYIHNLFDLVM